VAGSLILTAGMLVGNIVVAAFRQDYCPPDMLGRVVVGMRFLAFGAIPVGALLADGLGTAEGVRTAIWATPAVNALSGVFLLRSAKDLPANCRIDI
jgi:hypothetical protein